MTTTSLGPVRARDDNRWAGLRTVIWARLLVAALGLPFGILLGRDSVVAAWWLLGVTLGVIGVASALFWLGTVWRRAYPAQVYIQLTVDVTLVTTLASLTGGNQSPFSLFYVLVVITAGLQAGLTGGLITAVASSLGFLALNPSGSGLIGLGSGAELPKPGMLAALLVALGVLAAALRRRVQGAREHLERAARELDRVRLDHDAILRHLTSGVMTLDGVGAVAYLNPAAEEVLDLRFADLRGRRVEEVLPERLTPLRDALMSVLESHATQSRGELRLIAASGRAIPLGISTNILRHDGQVTGVVGVFQDLTEVREMEERARRNQTLAEVGALAAGIAHELRNGLSPISGSVECLQRELKLEGENGQLMELIQAECSRLNRFVTDLLTYSRERSLVKQPMDLCDNLAELSEAVKRDPRLGAQVTVRYQPGEGTAEIQADREQLRQVWLNLVRNALEAMGEAGTLTLRWRAGENDTVVVEFIDTGSGIAPEHLTRLGQPFFTTKKGGTGLGLPIAQRIVEQHGGTLALRPAPGGGAIATVTLPGAVVAAARAA